jgi:hypothetical protein
VNLGPYEMHTTIRLHRQDLLREAERERLLASPARSAGLKLLLARTGRFLIDVGTRLEARYATPSLSAVGHSPHADRSIMRTGPIRRLRRLTQILFGGVSICVNLRADCARRRISP